MDSGRYTGACSVRKGSAGCIGSTDETDEGEEDTVAVPECPRRIQVLPACVVRKNLCGPSGFLTAVHGIGVCRGIRIGKSTVIYSRLIGVCGRTLIDVRVTVKN